MRDFAAARAPHGCTTTIMDGDTGTEATRAIPQMFRGTTPVSDLAIFSWASPARLEPC